MIATAINSGDSTDFSEDSAGGLISAINAVKVMDCADITVSDDTVDGLIATAINAGNSTGCDEDTAGGIIADIYASVSMNFAYILISYDAEDGLINNPINADELIATPINSTNCANTNFSDDAIDILMFLIC